VTGDAGFTITRDNVSISRNYKPISANAVNNGKHVKISSILLVCQDHFIEKLMKFVFIGYCVLKASSKQWRFFWFRTFRQSFVAVISPGSADCCECCCQYDKQHTKIH
jgi:hypothetical protein